MSLRTRMSVVCALVMVIAMAVAGSAIFLALRADLRGQVEDSLRARAGQLVDGTMGGGRGPAPGGGGRPGRPPGLPSLAERARQNPFGGPSGYVQFVTNRGQVRRPSDERSALPVPGEVMQIARREGGELTYTSDAQGIHVMVYTVGVRGGAFQVARPLEEVDAALRHAGWILLLCGMLGAALVSVAAWVVARAALAPVTAFTSRAERIAEAHEPSQRMEVVGSDELSRLARTFNGTLDELERSVDAQKQLVADASHELRTPLASLRANVQVLEDADRLPADELARLRADIITEIDELTALVGDVVELARGSEPPATTDDIALDELVRSLAARAEKRGSSDVRFELDLEPLVIEGDQPRIARAVSNVLDNARKWSPAGGVVDVSLRDGVLSVRDRGPGFTETDLPHVFERFYRSDAARGMQGSGLGLAIVQQTTESHGGWVRAENAEDGGARVTLSFGTP